MRSTSATWWPAAEGLPLAVSSPALSYRKRIAAWARLSGTTRSRSEAISAAVTAPLATRALAAQRAWSIRSATVEGRSARPPSLAVSSSPCSNVSSAVLLNRRPKAARSAWKLAGKAVSGST